LVFFASASEDHDAIDAHILSKYYYSS